MSLAARYRLSLQQGGAHSLVLTYLDEDTGNPVVDLSTYEAELQIRKALTDAVEMELTSSAGEITFDSTAGSITCTFTKAQIDALSTENREITDWVWGLQIWDSGSKDSTAVLLVRGPVTISPSPVR